MITQDQVIDGIVTFLEKEIIPKIVDYPKWLLGGFPKRIIEYQKKKGLLVLDMTGCLTETGMVDAEGFTDGILEAARKYGSVTHKFPFIGDVTLTEADILALKRYLGI